MAIGRMNVRVGKKGKALPHLKYIQAHDKYANKIDEIVHIEHLNMPTWAVDDPRIFWSASDELERKNGSVYREQILSLPRELSDAQNLDLTRQWVAQECGEKHTLSYAFHKTKASDGGMQPHVHLMICERELDGIERNREQFFKRYNSKNPEKGGAKKLNTGMKSSERKKLLYAQRERWGDLLNEYLLKHGFSPDVDMRNWVKRDEQSKPPNYAIGVIKREIVSEHAIFNRPIRDIMPFYLFEGFDERNRRPMKKISFAELGERAKNKQRDRIFSEYINSSYKPVYANDMQKMGELELQIYSSLHDENGSLDIQLPTFKDYNKMTVARFYGKYCGLDLEKHNAELQRLHSRNPPKVAVPQGTPIAPKVPQGAEGTAIPRPKPQ